MSHFAVAGAYDSLYTHSVFRVTLSFASYECGDQAEEARQIHRINVRLDH